MSVVLVNGELYFQVRILYAQIVYAHFFICYVYVMVDCKNGAISTNLFTIRRPRIERRGFFLWDLLHFSKQFTG